MSEELCFTVDQGLVYKRVMKAVGVSLTSVKNTVELLADDATVPFIARYRKEMTGGLDETQIRGVQEKWGYYLELEKRKEFVLKTIASQDKLTDELRKKIIACEEKQPLEDLYLPYKPKKRTKAMIAREKGLEPLAVLIMKQEKLAVDKDAILVDFVSTETGVLSTQEALNGALDIIAEDIADSPEIRGWLRQYIETKGVLTTKARKEWADKKTKYEMYYAFSEPVADAVSHRLLAIRRGALEGVLSWTIAVDSKKVLSFIEDHVITNDDALFIDDIYVTIQAVYKRLSISLESEVFTKALQEAEREAISVFSKNLQNLLLDPPAGHHVIMGIDPGFRTGCKVAVLDAYGTFKEYQAIFPHPPQHDETSAASVILGFIKKYDIALIAIGNGTASRETETFVRGIVPKNSGVQIVMVSEAGASVYSASETAIREFPQLDVTVRGAISIARRLQDPLSELVKIDPKSIGVGQYQHDVNQNQLKGSLDVVVESCVNYVGVDVNVASLELLSYVSGIGKALAKNIVDHRAASGPFAKRNDLLKVPKLGAKAFEQSAGFLRIKNGKNRLDDSSIHPERYAIVKRMAQDLSVDVDALIGNKQVIAKISLDTYVSDDVGLPTLKDIAAELQKPGLDPRDEFTAVEFRDDIQDINDLHEDLELTGKVTNVTNFGAFVDIGVHQDGLVHISKLSDRFVKDPHEVVAVGDTVRVKVLSVDTELKRISLERLV